MFTGIVEELGEVIEVRELGDSSRFRLRGPKVTKDAQGGDSIAVNGVCLTVVDSAGGEFTADVMAETLLRSSLGAAAIQHLLRSPRSEAAADQSAPVLLPSRLVVRGSTTRTVG